MSSSSGNVATGSSEGPVRGEDILQMGLAAMSIDVEDWFQVENLKPMIPRPTWDSQESRVERNTMRILEILAQRQARGTFFILGWVAERQPALIRRIAEHGHEIASHG